MTLTIAIDTNHINTLDLSPVVSSIQPLLQDNDLTQHEQQLQFQVECDREPNDPRELSEIPEIRLWFVRLDTRYPWLLFLLDWKAGELVRYTAMLVPHQFHPRDGILFNPEALELFVMSKVFVLSDWLQAQGIDGTSRLKSMTQVLGYELDESFFALLKS
jgi:hypothetical protein